MTNLLTDEEVLKILKKSCKSPNEVSKIKWTLIEVGGELLGFLGKYYRLKIDACIDDKKTTKHFFVKTLPTSAQQSGFIKEINLFTKETNIYSDIISKMSHEGSVKWTAKSYYSRDDVLVLEDLSAENYKLMPSRQDFTKSHVQLVLKSLASLHANSFYFEKEILKKPLDELFHEILFEVSVKEENVWFMKGLEAIKTVGVERSRFSNDPEKVQWIRDNFDKVIKNVMEICNNYTKEFIKTFCHRDIWRNNLMYKFEMDECGNVNYDKPSHCALIDYQIARYMPPAADVVMTLYMLQRVNERKNDFHENVKYYYQQLDEACKEFNLNIEELLTYDELLKTCDYFKLLGAVLKCIFLQMTHLPDGEIDKIHSNDDDYTQFITMERGSTLVKYIDSDDYFKTWMVESVDELLEMLMNI